MTTCHSSQPTNQEGLSPLRVGRVTGSRVGGILGLSPWQTPDDVLRSMVREAHGAPSEFTGNAATEWGTFHERGVIQDFQMETGLTVNPSRFYTFEDWLGATPDGEIGEDELIEVKCPYGLRKGGEFKSINDMPHYHAQIMVQLMVTGRKRCYFWQWAPHGTSLEIVEYDDIWPYGSVDDLKRFHTRYLKELDNPAHLEPKRKAIETLRAAELLKQYDEACAAADRKKEILDELVELAGESNAEICGRKLTQVERKGNVSYAKVIKDHCPDVDLEPYRGKGSKFWKLT